MRTDQSRRSKMSVLTKFWQSSHCENCSSPSHSIGHRGHICQNSSNSISALVLHQYPLSALSLSVPLFTGTRPLIGFIQCSYCGQGCLGSLELLPLEHGCAGGVHRCGLLQERHRLLVVAVLHGDEAQVLQAMPMQRVGSQRLVCGARCRGTWIAQDADDGAQRSFRMQHGPEYCVQVHHR
jgi:hypothetical protein